MKTGLSTYTYTWSFGVPGSEPAVRMTPAQLADRAAQLGAGCIQIADNFPLSDMHDEELEGLRNHANNQGIEIETGSRGLTEENLQRFISIAHKLASPLLRMVIDHQDYQPDSDTVAGIIKNASETLKKTGIVLGIENHDRMHAKEFRYIIEKSKSSQAGICLDCVNSMGIGEGIETVLNQLAEYTVNLHVKDFTVKRVHHKMGFVIEGTPAGKGFLDLEHVLKCLEPYKRCRSAILELWTPPSPTLEETIAMENSWATESFLYMKKIIQP